MKPKLAIYAIFCVAISCKIANGEALAIADHGDYRIRLADLDGTSTCDLSLQTVFVEGIAVDNEDRIYFWTIGQAVFKETFGPATANSYLFVGESVVDCDVDWINKKLYFGFNAFDGEVLTGGIYRCDYDFGNLELIVDDAVPLHLAIDPFNNHIYWTDRQMGNRILRTELDGTNLEEIHVRDPGGVEMLHTRGRGLSIDFNNQKLYWSEEINGIFRSNLDGSGFEFLAPAVLAGFVLVDSPRSRILYSKSFGIDQGVYEADLDGSNSQLTSISNDLISDAELIDIDLLNIGDTNWDEVIDEGDIESFVSVILDTDDIECTRQRADLDGNGTINGLDLAIFVDCVVSGICP